MEKAASTKYDIHPLLSKRWSPRAFSQEPVSVEIMQRIFEAARWTPSSSNDQSWRFIIGFKGDETYQKIFDTLIEFNQLWAGDAPVLILNCGDTVSKKTGKPNSIYTYDVGQAAAMITVQAAFEGLFVHQMGGFDKEKAKTLFHIPELIEPLTVMAIGRYGDLSKLHPNLRPMETAERVRNNFDTFVFANKYGEPGKLFG